MALDSRSFSRKKAIVMISLVLLFAIVSIALFLTSRQDEYAKLFFLLSMAVLSLAIVWLVKGMSTGLIFTEGGVRIIGLLSQQSEIPYPMIVSMSIFCKMNGDEAWAWFEAKLKDGGKRKIALALDHSAVKSFVSSAEKILSEKGFGKMDVEPERTNLFGLPIVFWQTYEYRFERKPKEKER